MTEKEFNIHILPLAKVVYPMAWRMLHSEEAAKEAVQVSMMKLWQKRKNLEGFTNLRAYVFSVVRNTCLDEIKRMKPILSDDPGTFDRDSNDLNSYLENREAIEIIAEVIESLPAKQQEVIQLRDIDGLSFEDIAKITLTDLAYVRVLLSRARRTVKEQLLKVYDYGLNEQKKDA